MKTLLLGATLALAPLSLALAHDHAAPAEATTATPAVTSPTAPEAISGTTHSLKKAEGKASYGDSMKKDADHSGHSH